MTFLPKSEDCVSPVCATRAVIACLLGLFPFIILEGICQKCALHSGSLGERTESAPNRHSSHSAGTTEAVYTTNFVETCQFFRRHVLPRNTHICINITRMWPLGSFEFWMREIGAQLAHTDKQYEASRRERVTPLTSVAERHLIRRLSRRRSNRSFSQGRGDGPSNPLFSLEGVLAWFLFVSTRPKWPSPVTYRWVSRWLASDSRAAG
jgi:hypothetical protein